MRKQKPREIQWLTDGRTYSEIQYFLHNLEGYIPENLHGKEKLCLRDLWPWEETRVWEVSAWIEGSYHNCFIFPNIKYYRCHWHSLYLINKFVTSPLKMIFIYPLECLITNSIVSLFVQYLKTSCHLFSFLQIIVTMDSFLFQVLWSLFFVHLLWLFLLNSLLPWLCDNSHFFLILFPPF